MQTSQKGGVLAQEVDNVHIPGGRLGAWRLHEGREHCSRHSLCAMLPVLCHWLGLI